MKEKTISDCWGLKKYSVYYEQTKMKVASFIMLRDFR